MKILHVITGLKIGGAESVLYNILAHIDRSRDTHSVIYFHDGPNAARIRSLGIHATRIQGLFSPYDPVGIARLIWFVYHNKPDLIHSSLWSATILGRLLSFLFRLPLVSDLHCNASSVGVFRNAIDRLTCRFSATCIAVAPSVKESFNSQVFYAAKKAPPIEVVYNGIDTASHEGLEHFSCHELYDKKMKDASCDFIFGAVGRLVSIKKFDLLIRAFASFSSDVAQARLYIVGGGLLRDELELLARRLHVHTTVIFTGEVENAAMLYPLFDCFVQPSESEGLSMALLEACSFGLPVIVSGTSGKHDIIEDGVNGFVISPTDSSSLAAAMLKMYQSPSFRMQASKKNRDLAMHRFNIQTMVENYTRIFHSFEKKDQSHNEYL